MARVIDGDTIVVGENEKVRLLGIDTPEISRSKKKPHDCFAIKAKDFVKTRIEGKQVKIITEHPHKDRYGRTLAWVYYGKDYKKLLNAEIVSEGYGISFRKYPTSKLELLNKLEAEAKKQGKGLWAEGVCK